MTNLEKYPPALSCSGSDGHPLALVDPHRVVRRNCVLVKLALRARMIVCMLFVVPSRRLFKIHQLIEHNPASQIDLDYKPVSVLVAGLPFLFLITSSAAFLILAVRAQILPRLALQQGFSYIFLLLVALVETKRKKEKVNTITNYFIKPFVLYPCHCHHRSCGNFFCSPSSSPSQKCELSFFFQV